MNLQKSIPGFLISVLLFYNVASPFSFPNDRIVIAVVDFKNTGQDESYNFLEETISEAIITKLAKGGNFEIVERSRLKEALKEIELGMTGLLDEQTAAEVGRAVGANAILLGSFVSIGNVIRINARLIDVETSKIINAEIVQGGVGKEIFNLMDKLADSIEAQLRGETEPIVQDRPIPVEAQLPGEAKPIVQDRTIPVKAEKKIDSWFFRIAVGAANNIYPEELQDALDELEDLQGVSKISFGFDISLYRSLSDRKTMVGFTYNGSGDAYEFKGDELNFYQYLYGISLVHYPAHHLGKGIYVRADLGTSLLIFDSSFSEAEQSENGFGYQLGVGFSLATAIGIELDGMISYGGKKIEDEDYSVTQFIFGVSF